MTLTTGLLAAYAGLSLLYWLRTLYGVLRTRWCVRVLATLDSPEPDRWPRLSVIVPACNEADKIASAARSLLDEDYPEMEVVLVDDRSTDATGRIIDELAAADDRVRAIHIAELPDGWLGKVHALNTGLAVCSGRFVLLTDADVHFEAGTLRKAVALCVSEGLDHLAAMPDLWAGTRVCDAVVNSFLRQLLTLLTPAWQAQNPSSRGFLGVGAFNMVRRVAFDATDGFEWLRLEVADDMGVAMMMKRSGARAGVVAAFGSVGLHWYRTLGEACRGAEKGYATTGCHVGPMVLVTLVALGLEASPVVAPLVAALRGWGPAGWALAGAVPATFLASSVSLALWARLRILPAVLTPLTAPISAAIMLWSAAAGAWRGGVVWRGTLYRSAALRKGRRLRLF